MVNMPIHSPASNTLSSGSAPSSFETWFAVLLLGIATQMKIVAPDSVILLIHVDCGSCDSTSNSAENASGAVLSEWSLKSRNLLARLVICSIPTFLGIKVVL